MRRGRVVVGILGAITLVVVIAALRASATPAAPGAAPCNLVPQLRDVTVNQGLGGYSPLVNGKETLVRFYLSMPSCAGSGASIQITGGTLAVCRVARAAPIPTPTPVPIATAYPVIAAFTRRSDGGLDRRPEVRRPGSMVLDARRRSPRTSRRRSTYRSRASKTDRTARSSRSPSRRVPARATRSARASIAPRTRSGSSSSPWATGRRPYSTQWTATAQQALQDGMTAAVSREYPLPAGSATSGNRRAPLLGRADAARPEAPEPARREREVLRHGRELRRDQGPAGAVPSLLQHGEPERAGEPRRGGRRSGRRARAPEPAASRGWRSSTRRRRGRIARPGRAGQLIGLELAHTLGLTPPNRESPFDGAHSQNITAENPLAQPALQRRPALVHHRPTAA